MLAEFQRHFGVKFSHLDQLKLALTHRSYLSVTGQGPRESNERLEFLGDSVLGLVTSEYLYRKHPDEHEGQLTKTKSLLVSKAILSRRALKMGLGRFVLMSHSEVESGGRQRLSILADAFESVVAAIYLDQGFEAAREWIHQWLLRDTVEIVADKRHTNYKSHLQEYVQSTFRTHPVYRIRSEFGPDHSKHFMVEVMVGRRTLGEGKGLNKKEAEQAAARDALEKVETLRREKRGELDTGVREREAPRERSERPARADARAVITATEADDPEIDEALAPRRGRRRRGGRGREEGARPVRETPARQESARSVEPEEFDDPPAREESAPPRREAPVPEARRPVVRRDTSPSRIYVEDEDEGYPVAPHEEMHVDPYGVEDPPTVAEVAEAAPVHTPAPSRERRPAPRDRVPEVVEEDFDEPVRTPHRAEEDQFASEADEPPAAAEPPVHPPAAPTFGRRGKKRGR